MLLVDVSGSSKFGSQGTLKKDVFNEIAATLAFSALKNNDKVGVIFFSDIIEKYIPPKKGKSHILRIIRELIETEADSSKTDIGEALRFMQNTLKKKSVAFIISDFMESADYEKELALASNRNQFFGVKINDPLERAFPNIGLVQIHNAETGSLEWIDTSSNDLKNNLSSVFEQQANESKKLFEKFGASFCQIESNRPYIAALAKMFKK